MIVDDAPPPSDDDAPDAEPRAHSNVRPISAARKRRKEKVQLGERTELQIAEMLVAKFGDDLRYCGSDWYAWDAVRWARDERERAREAAKAVARDLAAAALETLDDDTFKSAKRASSAGGVSAVLDLARSTPGIRLVPSDLDVDPWLLCTPGATVDLRTGTARPNAREDLITRVTGARYDAKATCPMFDRFLAEVQPLEEMRAYLARLIGYAATGLTREQMIAVFWGPGANGKSVFAEVVMGRLGEYAKPGPSSLIVAAGGSEPHPTDVASLFRTRLSVVHETKRGAAFDASKLKLLTGSDRLTARHMREDFFDFVPTHTLLLLSNYKPQADGSDAALWRRMQLVPWSVVIPEERRDRELAARIGATEGPGVLRWIVDGCREYQRIGLAPPALVLEQTADYRASEDTVAAFLDERCTVLPGLPPQPAGALYAAYKKWCDANGAKAARSNDFSEEIRGRGFRREKTNAGAFYLGISLTHDDEDGGRT